MWIMEVFGMKGLFDIRRFLLGLVPLAIYLIREIIVYKRKKGKLWTGIAVIFIYIILAIVIGKNFAFSIVSDVILLMFFWALWISVRMTLNLSWSKKLVINSLCDTIVYIFCLFIVSTIWTGPILYNKNVIELLPETETTVCCITTGEYVLEDVIPEGTILSSGTRYVDTQNKYPIYRELVLIDGENDYIKKSVRNYYTEDRNVEPAVRSFSRTEISYILYVGRDGVISIDETYS